MSGESSNAPPEAQPSRPQTLRPSYKGLQPASLRASMAARGSSKKTDTRCEVMLRRVLWAAGCRYRKNAKELPGRPDVVFPRARIAVFCDGDFWHGQDWESRRQKLSRGTNSEYWLAKIQRNMERDRQNDRRLQEMGWTVLRFWESQIRTDVGAIARIVLSLLREETAPASALDERHASGVKRA